MKRKETLPSGKLDPSFLTRLLARVKTDRPDLLLGPRPGTDAALVQIGPEVLAITSDPITFVTTRLAAYLVQVNANDLAVCGARPEYLVLDLLVPPGTPAHDLEAFFEDLRAEIHPLGIAVIGGHTEVTDAVQRMVAVGTLIGRVEARHLHPDQVRPGDRLLQVQPVPIEGMAILAQEMPETLREVLGEEEIQKCQRLMDDPGIGVLAWAQRIWPIREVRWMHDPTEGGIATAIHEMAMATGLGIVVEPDRFLVLPEAQKAARRLKFDPLGLIASGCLLVAVAPEGVDRVRAALQGEKVPVQEIGKFQKEPGVWVQREGEPPAPLPMFAQDELTRLL